jgi:hypothetical protein
MTIHYAHITWCPSTDPDFAAYLIEREDDVTEGYRTIARVTSEAVTGFNDYEGRRNIEANYRMRVERSDGATSVYTDVETADPEFTQCGYQLTSNEDPSLNLEYMDTPDRVYDFQDPVQEWELFDRDFAVMFRQTEDRGVVFVINFWLYMDGTPVANNVPDNLRGFQAFTALKTLVRADLSYVCVLDEDGNKWFAALRMDGQKATRKEPGGKYLFPIRVRQVTTTPTTPDELP